VWIYVWLLQASLYLRPYSNYCWIWECFALILFVLYIIYLCVASSWAWIMLVCGAHSPLLYYGLSTMYYQVFEPVRSLELRFLRFTWLRWSGDIVAYFEISISLTGFWSLDLDLKTKNFKTKVVADLILIF
jgi:hypothetical protein